LEPSNTSRLYEYKPLESPETVRILVLQPAANFNDPPGCEIIHRNRHQLLLDEDDSEHYEAVSYTWGTPEFTHSITCDEGTTTLKITPSVDLLLRQVRKQRYVRYLWVDAICLNQADKVEKYVQGGLMGDIYRQARRVLIWLGKATTDENIPAYFAFLKRSAGMKNIQVSSGSVLWLSKEVLKSDDWLQLTQQILSRPWFLRRWVLQEVALGHDSIVYCGRHKMSWHWFAHGLLKIKLIFKLQNHSIDDIPSKAYDVVSHLHSHSNDLLKLLMEFRSSSCSNPRDRIFALVGLAESLKQSVVGMSAFHHSDRRSLVDTGRVGLSFIAVSRRTASIPGTYQNYFNSDSCLGVSQKP
jgi:hypothetical protein